MKLLDALDLVGKPFSYYPNLAKAFAVEAERLAEQDKDRERPSYAVSEAAAIFFCALIWRDKDRDEHTPKGPVFIKTLNQVCDETGLSFKRAKAAKEFLETIKIVKTKYNRIAHDSSYELDSERAQEIMEAWSKTHHSPNKTMVQIRPSPQPKEGHPESPNRAVDHCLEKEERKERELPPDFSPQPGEGYLPFKYLVRVYPKHRFENPKSVRAAERMWGKIPPAEQRDILMAVENLVGSPEWLQDRGKWVPNPDHFLENRDSWLARVKPNHKTQVEEIHAFFLAVSKQPATLNKLTPELREHISHRYDEALEMTRGQPTEPWQLFRDAVTACLEAHAKKKIITNLEHIFGSTGNFERWVKKAGYAS